MRILQINLIAFGPFTDSRIDLSGGQQGLHVVYGPNEAGKSSSLRSISNLLYGFPSSTDDDFLHPYKKLRIGGQLRHSDGTQLDVVRRKAKGGSLRDANDADAVDEQYLAGWLSDVDRELFELMFGINHQRLVAGGREVGRGQGRLGQMLFAAGAGLNDLQRTQTQLQQQSDAILKSTGRSGSLLDDVKQFQALRKSVSEAQVSIETWKKHRRAVADAVSEKEQLVDQIKQRKAQQSRLNRIQQAIPLVVAWQKAKDEIATLGSIKILPDGFAKQCQELRTELTVGRQQAADTESALKANEHALGKLVVSEDVLGEAGSIEAVRDRLARYQDAQQARPETKSRRDAAEEEARDVLRQLGRQPDLELIESLRLPSDKVVRIQTLGSQHDGLREKYKSAERECKKLQDEIARTKESLKSTSVSEDAGSLKTILRKVHPQRELETELVRLQARQAQQQIELDLEIKRLPGWSGDLQALSEMAVPSRSTISRFAKDFTDVAQKLSGVITDESELDQQRRRVEAERIKLEGDQAVPTAAQLAEARQLRDLGWQLISKKWHDDSAKKGLGDADATDFLSRFPLATNLADAFWQSVQGVDRLSDALRSDADRVASKAQMEIEQQQIQVRVKALKSKSAEVIARQELLQENWLNLWQPLRVEALPPEEMLEWIEQQQALVAAFKESQELIASIDDAELKVRESRELLASALGGNERDEISLPDLLDQVDAKMEQVQRDVNQREQLETSLRELTERLEDVQQRESTAKAELEAWATDWRVEMERLGLEPAALPAQAISFLNNLTSLLQKQVDIQRLTKQVEDFDREIAAFEEGVSELVNRVAADLIDSPCDQAVVKLGQRLQDARESNQQRDLLKKKDVEDRQRLELATQTIARVSLVLDELVNQAGCESPERLGEAAEQSDRKRTLKQRIAELETQLIEQSGGVPLEEFVLQVQRESEDADSIKPQIDEWEVEISQLEDKRDETLRMLEREELGLKQIDGSGQAAQYELECQSLKTKLEDDVKRLAALRLASSVLAAGIESHREKNQGPVLARASDFFGRMTCGAFAGLRADFNDKGEPVLVGIRSGSDDAVGLGGMSDGTCDQVYLALRLASLEAWLDQHEPIPLIVDDILMNFDDARSIATLQVLAELSRKTQVIFFTHHRHLVELAEENLDAADLFQTQIVGANTPAANVPAAEYAATEKKPKPSSGQQTLFTGQ